jgi:hypothetical protein
VAVFSITHCPWKSARVPYTIIFCTFNLALEVGEIFFVLSINCLDYSCYSNLGELYILIPRYIPTQS